MIRTGSNVIVTTIQNPDAAPHLIFYQGYKGKVISWVCYTNKGMKFKVILDDGITAYFWNTELEEVNG